MHRSLPARGSTAAFARRRVPGLPWIDLCGDRDVAVLPFGAGGRSAVRVRADPEAPPFRRAKLGGAWACGAYRFVATTRLPLALAALHRALAMGAPFEMGVHGGDGGSAAGDDAPGHRGPTWDRQRLAAVVEGAGFEAVAVERARRDGRGRRAAGDGLWVRATRARTLPDFVAPGMRLLVCGLNPSLVAADAGFGYAGATNRFWPAALEAGLVTRVRDPLWALTVDRVGMTDLVKRATPRAAELTGGEYRAGAARVRELVTWLRPAAVVFVGLAGWRAAVDAAAGPGVQPRPFGGAPAYVMPSTSGLNARTARTELAEHLRAALVLAGQS